MIYNKKEEGHYTLKQVKRLPKRGNCNWLYYFDKGYIDILYKWDFIEKIWVEIKLGCCGQGIDSIREGDNVTIDYTDPKNPIINASDIGEQNVQSDWNQTDVSADDYIKNKPVIPTNSGDDNVQSDWQETDVNSDSFIKNKPDIVNYQEGTNITIDRTDPLNPIINSTVQGVTVEQNNKTIVITIPVHSYYITESELNFKREDYDSLLQSYLNNITVTVNEDENLYIVFEGLQKYVVIGS